MTTVRRLLLALIGGLLAPSAQAQCGGGNLICFASPLVLTVTPQRTGTSVWACATLGDGISPQVIYEKGHGAFGAAMLTFSGLDVPAGSTIGEADAFFAGMTVESTSSNAVGYGASMFAGAAGAKMWFQNGLIDDGGFAAATVIYGEGDVGCHNTASNCIGMNMIGVFPNGTPTSAFAYQAARLNAAGRWNYAFTSPDDASNNALLVGTVGLTANSNGQAVVFDSRDQANVVQQCTLAGLHLTSAGGVLFGCSISGTKIGALVLSNSAVQMQNYLVAGLPDCTAAQRGQMVYVTDALTPSYNATLAGGGAVAVVAFCNGSAWTAH